jgi:enamidase
MRRLIANIGELFTGDLAAPMAGHGAILIEDGVIRAFDPPAETVCDDVIDAAGGAVMPGLVDGHVHPVLGEWTPTQDALGWIGNYLHGGTTSMVSAGELHTPGLDYANLTAELVTSLATVTRATTGRVRWSGVKLLAGTVLLVPGMTETHFDRLAAAGVRMAKFLFFPLATRREEATDYVRWCRARGIRVKVHTGGVSRSGLSQICGFEILAWLQPDVAAHVSGGPIPMSDADLLRTIEETGFALEICSSGNDRSTLLAVRRMRELGCLQRLCLGTDTPGGTGVIPRGMLRSVLYLAGVCGLSAGEAIAVASGNTARAHGLDVGVLRVGAPADLVLCGRVEGSAGTTLTEAIEHGDLPGISYVLIDGEVVVSERSRQTPPPQVSGRFVAMAVSRESTVGDLLAACGCCAPGNLFRGPGVG